MKSAISIFVFLCSICALSASSDEMNNPHHLRKEILASQFVFVGKLEVTDYRFISEDLKVVPDSEGKIWKQFQSNRYESEIVPDRIQKWAVVHLSQMLRGDQSLAMPFLRESWLEPSRVICPHHASALSGDERIWFVVISEDFREASLRSMPIRHLEDVKALLKK